MSPVSIDSSHSSLDRWTVYDHLSTSYTEHLQIDEPVILQPQRPLQHQFSQQSIQYSDSHFSQTVPPPPLESSPMYDISSSETSLSSIQSQTQSQSYSHPHFDRVNSLQSPLQQYSSSHHRQSSNHSYSTRHQQQTSSAATRHHQQKVYRLFCKSCNTIVSERGMKAVLLLRPNITLYSTDATPLNCGNMTLPPEMACAERTCLCLTQSLGCFGCGTLIGYHILTPCQRCQGSALKHSRSANGHRFVFHMGEVGAEERKDNRGRNIYWNSLLDPIKAQQMELGRTIEELLDYEDFQAEQPTIATTAFSRRRSGSMKMEVDMNAIINTQPLPTEPPRPSSPPFACR